MRSRLLALLSPTGPKVIDFGIARTPEGTPTDQLRLAFGQVVDEFTSARGPFSDARTEVATSVPLSVAAAQHCKG